MNAALDRNAAKSRPCCRNHATPTAANTDASGTIPGGGHRAKLAVNVG
jgi:hypothetical protein